MLVLQSLRSRDKSIRAEAFLSTTTNSRTMSVDEDLSTSLSYLSLQLALGFRWILDFGPLDFGANLLEYPGGGFR